MTSTIAQQVADAKAVRKLQRERDELGIDAASLMQNPMAAMSKIGEIGKAIELSTELEKALLKVARHNEMMVLAAKKVADGTATFEDSFSFLEG
ncbi:MAG: hypothetical protein ACPGMR_11525 [Pontibacterium sp.]